MMEDGLGASHRNSQQSSGCQAATGAPVKASHCKTDSIARYQAKEGSSGRGCYREVTVN